MPLVERQKKLQEERARKEAENRARYEAQYGAQNNQLWDSLEQAGSKPPAASNSAQQAAQSADDNDLLSAFDASAPVDASTHFPVPSPSPTPSPPVEKSKANGTEPTRQGNGMEFFDDDDPFDLNQLKQKPAPASQAPQTDDDDFLGLLGKPVSEFTRPEPQPASVVPSHREEPPPSPKLSDDVDRAVAELVDMGFPADKATQALSTTDSGTDVQAAVGWLLNQAHAESRQKSRDRTPAGGGSDNLDHNRERSERRGHDAPTWMKDERPPMPRSKSDNRSPGTADKDASQLATSFGNNLLKTANSLWKTGSKRVQQVVNDLNTEQDPNAPRWMRNASAHEEPWPQEGQKGRHATPDQPPGKPEEFTDEALLLEPGAPHPSRHNAQLNGGPRPGVDSNSNMPQRFPPREQTMRPPAFMQHQVRQGRDPKSKLDRKVVEEQSTQAYVSPARRKRPVPQPPVSEKTVDLFESPAPLGPKPSASPQPQKSSPSATLPARPKARPREIPPVSQHALMSAHRQRDRGTEAYKRGDYAVAHEAFSAALTILPDKHPVNIILRGNHAMTALKIGEPKTAIVDVDAMLEIIGPSKGEAENIDPGNGEPSKAMRDFFGKAVMRKAEALEQLEKWGDAAAAWKLAVQTGHGGSASIQARNRCEKAAGISKPAPKPPAPKKPAARKKPSALEGLTGADASSTRDSAAVGRLRAANQEAERADEEKFALSDSVDARLAAWKNGKQDNLRALLGSLDTVLWPGAEWKKVNMSELVLPNKVKVQYMKGISKVHPDKVCPCLSHLGPG